jgi:hypothetical protein
MDNDAYIKANDEDQTSLGDYSQDGGSDTVGPREECWCADEDMPCFDHYGGEDGD